MKRIATAKSWSKKTGTIQPALVRYRRFLEDRMMAASTIESYLNRVKLFLQWAETVDWYELSNTGVMTVMSYQTNASKGFVFRCIPCFVKIVATEDEDGATCTVRVQPLNL